MRIFRWERESKTFPRPPLWPRLHPPRLRRLAQKNPAYMDEGSPLLAEVSAKMEHSNSAKNMRARAGTFWIIFIGSIFFILDQGGLPISAASGQAWHSVSTSVVSPPPTCCHSGSTCCHSVDTAPHVCETNVAPRSTHIGQLCTLDNFPISWAPCWLSPDPASACMCTYCA